MTGIEKSLAKLKGFDVGIEDHGCFVMFGTFYYENGPCQGLGYVINTAFIQKFMEVFGVEKLQQVNGKSCWVWHTHNGVTKMTPIHKADGREFDIVSWMEDCKKKEKLR